MSEVGEGEVAREFTVGAGLVTQASVQADVRDSEILGVISSKNPAVPMPRPAPVMNQTFLPELLACSVGVTSSFSARSWDSGRIPGEASRP
ncbi:hypothetical protein NFC73_18730 [Pseudarthrobacter sp. RMG13]|uniref:Uncharacterized protein n=1 Tax=Pseudarthrobacter humi TaxID=2952523 RepID=A0ABT1LTI8_9MICC|nr:hypothetical protein [Pseudarthrobacter humi]MCP9001747.1 hypothetical protein [Pseudarthrobacter humi]